MAIAENGAEVTGIVTTGDTTTLTSWTPAADDLILLAVAQRNEAIALSVTGNGLTWTEIANVDNAQGQGGIALWRASGASPTTGSVVVTHTANLLPVSCIAQRFSGVDVASANQGVEAFATSAGPAVDDDDMLLAVTTITANAWAVAAGWHRNANTLASPPDTGETVVLLNSLAGTAGDSTRCSMWYEGPVVTPASTQLGALNDTAAAGDWAMIVVSLKPFVAAGFDPALLRRPVQPEPAPSYL